MAGHVVAIVGRQNVGKSTLLNKLVGKPVSIVEDLPGTTRDRIFATVEWQGNSFTIVDTGGLEPTPLTSIARGVMEQIGAAIAEADLIIFLTDAQAGVTPVDLQMTDMLRKAHKPTLVVVNKADNTRLEAEASEFYTLGLGEPLPISAIHGRGTAELLDKIVAMLPETQTVELGPAIMKLAIVGKPNAGKSTLLNALVGKERSIVSEIPGTTRDAIDTILDFQGENVLLIDTGGIRKRGQISPGIERYSVIRALQAVERADICLLMLDAGGPVSAQDTHIAGFIKQAMRGLMLVVNKWDLVELKNQLEWTEYIRGQFNFVPYAPIYFTSAKLKQGLDKLLPGAIQIYKERSKLLPDELVHSVMQSAVSAHPLPKKGTKRLKVYNAAQTGTNPPTFTFNVNDSKIVHFSYQRYLENKIREHFDFSGTPVRLLFKSRSN